MTDNSVNITKHEFEGLKPYLDGAVVFINGNRVTMSLDDYLVADHQRTEAEHEDLFTFSFA